MLVLAMPPFRDAVSPGCCPVLWGWCVGSAAALGKGDKRSLGVM